MMFPAVVVCCRYRPLRVAEGGHPCQGPAIFRKGPCRPLLFLLIHNFHVFPLFPPCVEDSGRVEPIEVHPGEEHTILRAPQVGTVSLLQDH